MARPLRFAIDALAAATGGSVTYYEGILPALAEVDRDNEYLLLKAPWQTHLPPAPGPNFRWQECSVTSRSAGARLFYEQGPMISVLRAARMDVLYSPTETTTLLAPCRTVLALRNASAYGLRPGMGLRRWARSLLVVQAARASAWRARRVIFVSESSRDTILRRLRIPRSKTVVIHHGLHPAFRRAAWRPAEAPSPVITRPYILSVSQIRGGKNYPRLIEAFARLVRSGHADVDLVIVGGVEEAEAGRSIEATVRRERLEGRVHLPGAIPYLELPAWYASALMFVFPSMFETFGHPLVEAMAVGLPVLAASATSNPEILGGAGLLFDPNSVPAMTETMGRVLSEADLARDLSARSLARARAFSWTRSAELLRRVLEEVAVGEDAALGDSTEPSREGAAPAPHA